MRIIGLDPGLQHTGWGVIEAKGSALHFLAAGVVHSNAKENLARRLVQLHDGLREVLDRYEPEEAAVEETFVNKNPTSTLKLGVARGIALLVPALYGIKVGEYTANMVKKSVVGAGHAAKEQVQMMVRRLLPASSAESADAFDALAVAICHAHYASSLGKWGAQHYREVMR